MLLAQSRLPLYLKCWRLDFICIAAAICLASKYRSLKLFANIQAFGWPILLYFYLVLVAGKSLFKRVHYIIAARIKGVKFAMAAGRQHIGMYALYVIFLAEWLHAIQN